MHLKKYFQTNKKKIIFSFIAVCIVWILAIVSINMYIISFSKGFVYNNVQALPTVKIGLVLWAKVKITWVPSDILRDRLDGATEAYKLGKIQKIIVSWDNHIKGYDEPTNMLTYLTGAGIPEKDIYLDYAGFDTYDSFYRAREIFSVDKVIIFTQDFHQYRSNFIARELGIESYGLATDYHQYLSKNVNNFRESLARVKAFFDVFVLHSKPKFLGEKVAIK